MYIEPEILRGGKFYRSRLSCAPEWYLVARCARIITPLE